MKTAPKAIELCKKNMNKGLCKLKNNDRKKRLKFDHTWSSFNYVFIQPKSDFYDILAKIYK